MSEITSVGEGQVEAPADDVRVVSCDLGFVVVDRSELVLQLSASSRAGRVRSESLTVTTDGVAGPPPRMLEGPYGARVQVVDAPPGELQVRYRAEVVTAPTRVDPPPPGLSGDTDDELERQVYLRPSRYCPSDHLVGFAVAEFAQATTPHARVEAIAEWIRGRIGYVAGSSSVHDTAEHTLLTGMGTCRDYAHLGIALCRALGVPARFASVYAPGLSPMDFHAVFEARVGDRWLAYDTTDLAPRQAMVRIGTGRDAADAAFASVTRGIATLVQFEVTATVSGELPADDHRGPALLA